MSDNFEIWAIVELMGRNIVAGKVTEQTIAGDGFIRVDVPATHNQKGFTKFYSPSSIYAITPTDEATVLAAAEGLQTKPIEIYQLNLPSRSLLYDDER